MFGSYNPRHTLAAPVAAARTPWFVPRRFLRRFIRMLLLTWAGLILIAWVGAPAGLIYLSLTPPRWPVLHQLGMPGSLDQVTIQTHDLGTLPFPAEAVAFQTPDGLTLRGWFVRAGADAPVILLGHGYPGTREYMIPYAAMLYQAGYSALLFDWRAMGESQGERVTFGLHETDDLRGAINYLEARADLAHPRIGALGVSMGAGVMLIGAAQEHRIAAVVCDSTYPYLEPMFHEWDSVGLRFWPYHLPLAPVGYATANAMLDGKLARLNPIDYAAQISPNALLLIAAQHDHNPLTPVEGAWQIYTAARAPKQIWVAPEGDHAVVLPNNPDAYRQVVVRFFDQYLRDK